MRIMLDIGGFDMLLTNFARSYSTTERALKIFVSFV